MPIHASHVILPEYMISESWLGDFMCWKFEQGPDPRGKYLSSPASP
jgi:hypothetical protein